MPVPAIGRGENSAPLRRAIPGGPYRRRSPGRSGPQIATPARQTGPSGPNPAPGSPGSLRRSPTDERTAPSPSRTGADRIAGPERALRPSDFPRPSRRRASQPQAESAELCRKKPLGDPNPCFPMPRMLIHEALFVARWLGSSTARRRQILSRARRSQREKSQWPSTAL